MPQDLKTVFISYRRTKFALAEAVKANLERDGYRVFVDVSNLGQGDFLRRLEDEVKQHTHFLPLLTPDGIERCADENDVVRKEIEWALISEKNIVPLMFEGFKFSDAKPYLTGNLRLLSWYTGVNVPEDYFVEAMNRLKSRFLLSLEGLRHPPRGPIIEGGSRENLHQDETPEVKAERLLIRARQSLGNRYRAIDYLTQAIEINPKFIEAYYLRGKKFSNNGEHELALADWKQGLQITLASPRTQSNAVKQHLFSAYIAMSEHRLETALEEANKAVDLDALDYDVYFTRARIRVRIKQFDEAIEDYTRSINRNPNYAGAYNNRGIRYRNSGEFEKALADFSAAIRVEPEYPLPYVNRGELYFLRGQFQLAYDEFSQAIKLSPTSPTALAGLALTSLQLGEEYEAKKLWKHLIAINSIFGDLQNFEPALRRLDYLNEVLANAAYEVAKLSLT